MHSNVALRRAHFNQVLGLVGSYVYVVQVLRELICFDNFDQIFAHEAWEGRKGSTESLGKSSVGKRSACEWTQHLNGSLVCHLETKVGLRAIEFAEKFFVGLVLRRVCEGAYCMIVVDVIIWDEIFDFSQVNQ